MLIEFIGEAAMLEQAAEELAECAQACLKLARYKRGENPVYKEFEQLENNLHEEVADVHICLNELEMGNVLKMDNVNKWVSAKVKRMISRLEEKQIKELKEAERRLRNGSLHEDNKG